jgi:hypothetical protein
VAPQLGVGAGRVKVDARTRECLSIFFENKKAIQAMQIRKKEAEEKRTKKIKIKREGKKSVKA